MPEQFIVLAKDSLRPGAAVSFRSTPLPFAGRIRRLVVKHDANAAGASTFDVNLGGATIFAAPGDRPSVAAGETEAVIGNLSVAHAENAVLSLDADAVPLGGLTNVSVIVVSDDQLGDKPVPVEFFIRAMYLGVLGREPLSAELTSTEATLGAACLGLTFEAAAAAFATDLFTGAAFLALATTDEEFVTALYRGYFNREPDAGGLAHWTGEVGSTSREIVRAAFAADIGFRNRLPLFCRNAKPVADAGSIAGMSAAQFVYETVVAALVDSDDIGFEGAEGEHQAFLTETGVVAGEYGDATHIPVVTVDAKGRVTEITEVAVEGGGEGGAGDPARRPRHRRPRAKRRGRPPASKSPARLLSCYFPIGACGPEQLRGGFLMSKERGGGRRSSDRERTHLRRLENAVRLFVAYFEDHPAERFAPRTRKLVEDARAIFTDVDALRSAARSNATRQSTTTRRRKTA